MKKFSAFAIAAVMLISLAACSGNEVTGSNVAGGNTGQSSQLSMEDIVWSIDEGVVDGERYVCKR